jgi:hypothetical protein
MPTLEPVPWCAVAPCSVTLGGNVVLSVRDGIATLADGRTISIDPMSTVVILLPAPEEAFLNLLAVFPNLEIIDDRSI